MNKFVPTQILLSCKSTTSYKRSLGNGYISNMNLEQIKIKNNEQVEFTATGSSSGYKHRQLQEGIT